MRRRGTWIAGLVLGFGLAACGGGGGSEAPADVAAPLDIAEIGIPDTAEDLPPVEDLGEPDQGDGCWTTVEPRPGTVLTERGPVTGTQEGDTWVFRGIPYAAPPVAELRWQAPEPAPCWQEELVADSFGPRCPQLDGEGSVVGDEDCLTLNVWAPTDAADAPVLVFLHGGNNALGSASDVTDEGLPIYDGRRLAETGDIVVVTVNYRLGVFGFLALADLSEENPDGVSGNYGIRDQIAALQWVQANIAAFGGDPTRVTLGGQGGGARDVCTLIASPLAEGLFHRAIMESGGCTEQPLAGAEQDGERVAAEVSCGLVPGPDRLACLRELGAAELVAAMPARVLLGVPEVGKQAGFVYGPNVDDVVLDMMPFQALMAGQYHRVPLLLGSNADETLPFVPVFASIDEVGDALEDMFLETHPGLPANILGVESQPGAYPIQAYDGDLRKLFAAIKTDMLFTCPARLFARYVDAAQEEPVFRYVFRRVPAGEDPDTAGAFHGVERLYVFGTVHATEIGSYADGTDRDVADLVMGYWAAFVADGAPGEVDGLAWPLYETATDRLMLFGDASAAGIEFRSTECDMWDYNLPIPY